MAGGQTLRASLALWQEAVEAYTRGDHTAALDGYLRVEELSARMLYNMACAYMALDKTTLAIQCLSAAVKKDKHLAIAFFQKGVLNLKQNNYKGAIQDLGQAKTLMRGNTFIDYKPLGMYTKLGKFEILYNLALACLHDSHRSEAEGLFTEALHDADIRQRKLLISALEHVQDKNHSLISPVEISITNVFSPPKAVVDNLEKRKVMASAKVVSATDKHDIDPRFNGMKRVEELKRSPENSPKMRRSPLLKMKQFLWKQSRPKSASLDTPSAHSMRSAVSTGDIRSLPKMDEYPGASLANSMTSTNFRTIHRMNRSMDDTSSVSPRAESPTSSLEEFEIAPRTRTSSGASFRIVHSVSLDDGNTPPLKETRQRSIEEVCTTSATCIAQALTSNCDVTIVVTPPATSTNNGVSKMILNANQTNDDVFVNNINHATEKKGNNNDQVPTGVNNVEVNNNVNSNDVRDGVNKSSPTSSPKSRPPPPSYPPPPLPSRVVFNI